MSKALADILHRTDLNTLKSQLAALATDKPELHAAVHAISLLIVRHSLTTNSLGHAQIIEYGTKLGGLVLSAAHSTMPSAGLARHLAELINADAAFKDLKGHVLKLGAENPSLIDVSQFN